MGHRTQATAKPTVIRLIADLEKIVKGIPVDLGGGSPLSKTFLMAYLAIEHDLRTYVEIGVYRGRSLFPMAHAMQVLGGMAYGIDPYDKELAKEHDLAEPVRQEVNAFIESLAFPQLYQDASALRDTHGLADSCELIRQPSADAAAFFRDHAILIDMLHIDGNHDTAQVMQDVELYLPLVRDGGFVVMDDIDWESVKPAFRKLGGSCEVIFLDEHYAILTKGNPVKRITDLEMRRYEILHSMLRNFEGGPVAHGQGTPARMPGPTKISVVVTSYNQEKYIAECLEGILAQRGSFTLELVIGDDGSTDSTPDVIQDYLQTLLHASVEVKLLAESRTLGMTKNLKRCLQACTGDYIAICEGDDYWVDCNKLQKQRDFLESHPQCALCFHDMYIYFQETQEVVTFDLQQHNLADVLTTRDIILEYTIGNMSTCMYAARFVTQLPSSLFELYVGDWIFNAFYSTFGDIGHVKEIMSVYRKHSQGAWGGKNPARAATELHALIDEYNRYLNYDFDTEYSVVKRQLEAGYPDQFNKIPLDLGIIDDVFPHPLSPFRVHEFKGYLEVLGRVRIYSSGESIHVLGSESLDALLRRFKRENPQWATDVEILRPDSRIHARLIYMIFLGNAYVNIERIEGLKTPFVFTLYPGGSFGLRNARSDVMLRRVTSSPCFRKVIVTQRITYDYLMDEGFCTPDQIEFIFGIVTPSRRLAPDGESPKVRFGSGKDTLDVCFVAYKYMEKGMDKGYDLFVDMAKSLSRKHSNIRFHVVGGFDETDIDVTDLQGRIVFYGSQGREWFDGFYADKDMILSPNIPSMIYKGSFDGFPTGSCIEAGLRRTAIFCTDVLHLNTQFVEGSEIVIIPANAGQAAEVVEWYYRNPQQLMSIGENGFTKIRELYSYEAQMLPRIRILKEEIRRAEASKEAIVMELESNAITYGEAGGGREGRPRTASTVLFSTAVRVGLVLRSRCPRWLMDLMKGTLQRIGANERLFHAGSSLLPEWVWRAYWEVQRSR